jgi:DNA-binding MarR family transcriptional regulator
MEARGTTTVREASDLTTVQSVAARIIETTPLIMYFIRRKARKDKSSSSIARTRVLAYLQNCPDSSLSMLSESLGVTNATASALVDSLVQENLVERQDDPNERRRVLLRLTRTGESKLETARRHRVAEIAEVLSDLPQDELEQIQCGLALLKKSFHNLNSRAGS